MRHNHHDDRSVSESESKHKSRREENNKELIRAAKSSKQKQREDVSGSESESDHREKRKSKSNSKRKEGKAVVKYKSSRQREESESESESDHPKQRKNRSAKDKSKALVKAKRSGKREDSDPESSNEEIVEKRKRYEEITLDELTHAYVTMIADIWEVAPKRVEAWCDNHNLIRLDTNDGSINLDKLIKKQPLEATNERMLESFQKRERRWVAENPGGYMTIIPRFSKGHQGGPSRRRPDVIVVDRIPVVPIRPTPPKPSGFYDERCALCIGRGSFCGEVESHFKQLRHWSSLWDLCRPSLH